VSTPNEPTRDREKELHAALAGFAERVEAEPTTVLAEIAEIADETSSWGRPDAHLWSNHITAQALRFLDDLDRAVAVAEEALARTDTDHGAGSAFLLNVRALLHLEAGMSLNQAGRQAAAEPHLRNALAAFERLGDDSGQSWARVARRGTMRDWPSRPSLTGRHHSAKTRPRRRRCTRGATSTTPTRGRATAARRTG